MDRRLYVPVNPFHARRAGEFANGDVGAPLLHSADVAALRNPIHS